MSAQSEVPGTATRVLRPWVLASPTVDGVHVRGWRTAFTVRGGDAWTLWQRLEPLLHQGVPVDRLAEWEDTAGPRRAVARVITALLEHDMLIDAAGPGQGWLAAAAPDPGPAGERLARTQVTVSGAGPVTAAATAALRSAGSTVVRAAQPAGSLTVLATAAGTVVAAADRRVGFVAGPGPAGQGQRIADRLGLTAGPPDPLLAAAAGGAAASRLVAEVARLPVVGLGRWPSVLVLRPSPLTATQHPWLLDGSRPDAGADVTDEDDAEGTSAVIDALCDEELGVLEPPLTATLPQVPLCLAVCHGALGSGGSVGAARLDAVLRAAGRSLAPHGRSAAGLDAARADGVLLRRAVLERLGRHTIRTVGRDRSWGDFPAARRWWVTLTGRLGVPATCTVTRLAGGGHVAVVRAGVGPAGAADAVGAVEADPGPAAAAALARMVARRQAADNGRVDAQVPDIAGAADPDTDEELQAALRRLLPVSGRPGPAPARAGALRAALDAAGLSIREIRR